MLANFDEIILQVKSTQAKGQITEAIRCYQNGAYRSAIVMTYIAICFDLIEKLKFLESTGDNIAQTLLANLQQSRQQLDSGNAQAIVPLLKFEKELIDKFRDDFQFFGINEYEEIARIRDDRNRCAHPTFYKSEQPYVPSAELTRLHIRNALELVLTQEPKQGKAALDDFRSMILSQYYPDDMLGIRKRLEGRGINSARDSLVRGLVDELVFGLPDSTDSYYGAKAALKTLDVLAEIKRPIVLPRITQNVEKLLNSNIDEAVEFGSLIVIENFEVADSIDSSIRPVVESWIGKAVIPKIADTVAKGLKIDWLSQATKDRLEQLDENQIAEADPKLSEQILDRAVDIYCSAGNWDKANHLAEKVAIPFAGTFSKKQIAVIFDQATNGDADLRGSHGFREFITKLYDENPLTKSKLNTLLKKYHLEAYKP